LIDGFFSGLMCFAVMVEDKRFVCVAMLYLVGFGRWFWVLVLRGGVVG
jgi:hypothetical protein